MELDPQVIKADGATIASFVLDVIHRFENFDAADLPDEALQQSADDQ